jgi:hypothetical protein
MYHCWVFVKSEPCLFVEIIGSSAKSVGKKWSSCLGPSYPLVGCHASENLTTVLFHPQILRRSQKVKMRIVN